MKQIIRNKIKKHMQNEMKGSGKDKKDQKKSPEIKSSLGSKTKYKFENFMAKGGKSVFISLFILFAVSFVISLIIRAVIMSLDPATESTVTWLEQLWITFLQITDPGAVAEETGKNMWFKLSGTITMFLGLIIFSMLVAFITTQVEELLYKLKKGKSKVIEEGHSLILGWNERVTDIIYELILANESEKDAAIVILADEDKEEMDDDIHNAFPDTKTTRIITRSGSPSSLTDLKRVNASNARSAIVLASCSDGADPDDQSTSDSRTIKSILALQALNNELPIIGEIFSAAKRELIDGFESDQVIALDSWDILGKILVQTSLTSGLEMVYNEMLSFDGCEVYFYEAKWNNTPFYDLAYHLVDGVPLGIRRADGSLDVRPESSAIMNDGDEIIVLAQDDSTIKFSKKPLFTAQDLPYEERRLEKQIEHQLILGWHNVAHILIREYSDYLQEGSLIDIMINDPSDEVKASIEAFKKEYHFLTINLIPGDPMSREHLSAISPTSYNTVIILNQNENDYDPERVDSDTLVILLLLRQIMEKAETTEKKTKIITQVLNSENAELITQTNVDDFLISNKLITMIIAQLSEQPEIKDFYDDLFQEDGSEIYLKPVSYYFKDLPIDVSFMDIMKAAGKRSEICLGVRINELAHNPEENFGVILDPLKTTRYTLSQDDFLVVLSEDEL